MKSKWHSIDPRIEPYSDAPFLKMGDHHDTSDDYSGNIY